MVFAINFSVHGDTRADLEEEANRIAEDFFGTLTGVTVTVGQASPSGEDERRRPTAWTTGAQAEQA